MILKSITEDFETFDVLADNEIREGIKTYSNWPTIPQCYIDGGVQAIQSMPARLRHLANRSHLVRAEFIGGCDLLIEMYQSGELQEEVEKAVSQIVVSEPLHALRQHWCPTSQHLAGGFLSNTSLTLQQPAWDLGYLLSS